MVWFVVLLLLAGAGFYFYQKLIGIEREIRAEQEAEKARATVVKARQEPQIEVNDEAVKVEPVVESEEGAGLETQIVAAVAEQPGVKQTELYMKFAEVNKKQLQQLLKEMADSGVLKREKKGSSYLLFPA